MSIVVAPTVIPDAAPISERLNRECFCITLDQSALCDALKREVGDPEFCDTFIKTRPHLFSRTPVFVPNEDVVRMQRIVRAIETAVRLPSYQAAALSWAPEIAQHEHRPRGAFMGYDFHLTPDGPKLIEVNTNAGGAFLNAALAQAQRACCAEMRVPSNGPRAAAFERTVIRMFQSEWTLQRGTGTPFRLAIVDDQPEAQYLYQEFLLAQRLLARHGIDSVIADGDDRRYENGRLMFDGKPVDLVYNRLVDFAFDRHSALRAAYLDDAVVVTPNPRVHALFADKRNLALLSDTARLGSWGLPAEFLADLASIPRTSLVTPQNAAELWTARRKLFFKPASGHGSKAVYRGDKVTKGVWAEIVRGGYVAQDFAAPSERAIAIEGIWESRKADFRLYIYDGEIVLVAARLYQGQTTNFQDARRRICARVRGVRRTIADNLGPITKSADHGRASFESQCVRPLYRRTNG
jgi:hypothetical protein